MNAPLTRTITSAVIGFATALTLQRALSATKHEPPQPPAAGAQAPAAVPQQGRGRGLQFTEPSPLDFNDHEGYVSIFAGRTPAGWDGNPKISRVDDGAI